MGKSDETPLWREALGLLPLYFLQVGSGLSGSFTTVLLDQFSLQEKEENSTLFDISNNSSLLNNSRSSGSCIGSKHGTKTFQLSVIGTVEDYAPVAVGFFGGFLQQFLGPRTMIWAAGFSGCLSWALVSAVPTSFPVIVFARFMAGLANGLLGGNVYLSDTVSTKNRSTLWLIESLMRSTGSVLLYVLAVLFYWEGLSRIALFAAIFPSIGFILSWRLPESPLHIASINCRKEKKIEAKKTEKCQFYFLRKGKRDRLVKLISRVYRPFSLILFIILVQHCSGFSFSKKFLLQLLNSGDESENEDPRTPYYYAIVISLLRCVANLSLAKLVRKYRIRSLYFTSVVCTAICLLTLASTTVLHVPSLHVVRLCVLSVHIVAVGLGLQSLGGILTDLVFPTYCRAVMKGVVRTVNSLTLVVFVVLMTMMDCAFSFFTMASILLLALPVLYCLVPETKNISRGLAKNFFLPTQTVFFYLLNSENDRCHQSRIKQMKPSLMQRSNSLIADTLKPEQISGFSRAKISRKISQTEFGVKYPTVVFDVDLNCPALRHPGVDPSVFAEWNPDVNFDRLAFLDSILSSTETLVKGCSHRFLIGKGPGVLVGEPIQKGNIFLLNDKVVVGSCLVPNRRYINTSIFTCSDKDFKIVREGTAIILKDNTSSRRIDVGEIAPLWEEYIFAVRNFTDSGSTSTRSTSIDVSEREQFGGSVTSEQQCAQNTMSV